MPKETYLSSDGWESGINIGGGEAQVVGKSCDPLRGPEDPRVVHRREGSAKIEEASSSSPLSPHSIPVSKIEIDLENVIDNLTTLNKPTL
eukprot:4109082-Pyramimonas_sp.AAC.1